MGMDYLYPISGYANCCSLELKMWEWKMLGLIHFWLSLGPVRKILECLVCFVLGDHKLFNTCRCYCRSVLVCRNPVLPPDREQGRHQRDHNLQRT